MPAHPEPEASSPVEGCVNTSTGQHASLCAGDDPRQQSLIVDARSSTAIVTGAAGGIGSAEAELLRAAGHYVVLNDVDESGLLGLAERLGGASATAVVVGDISSTRTADLLVQTATADGRRLAVVVNNAGVIADRMIYDLSDDDWDRTLAINLRGTFVLTRAAAVYWRREAKSSGNSVDACIVNTTSRAALLANPGQSNYAAAKAGVAVFSQIVARELSAYGVRVNAVAPRALTSAMKEIFGAFSADEVAHMSPHHIAQFVAYLCSDQGKDISGQVFVVQGRSVSLLHPWRIGDPVEFDFNAEPGTLANAMSTVFGDSDRCITPFRIGDDLSTTGGTR